MCRKVHDEIELEDGEFEIDSDFYSLDNNVYLALYDTGGDFLYGKVPPGLEQAPQFEDGKDPDGEKWNRAVVCV